MSDRQTNVILRDESGKRSDGQVLAFEDTWHWDPSAELPYGYPGRYQQAERIADKNVAEPHEMFG